MTTKQPDAIEQKVVSMLDALQEGAVHIGSTAVKYAPDVGDAVLGVTRVNGISHIVQALVGLVIAGIFYRTFKPLKAWAVRVDSRHDTPACVVPYLAIITSFIIFILSLSVLTHVWTWVAIFEPKLAIAKQIIDSAIK